MHGRRYRCQAADCQGYPRMNRVRVMVRLCKALKGRRPFGTLNSLPEYDREGDVDAGPSYSAYPLDQLKMSPEVRYWAV